MARSAPYGPLNAVDVLVLSSFIYLLNVSRHVAKYLISAGSVGELIIGMIYGTPITQWLHEYLQKATHDLGFIGVILLIFEGGLFTHLEELQRNIFLSMTVASTGVIVPMGLSFLLLCVGYGYPISTAFASGAALATTSLGTTFFILSTQTPYDPDGPEVHCPDAAKDIRHTRIGSVLQSAALIDDVIGLVLVSIVPIVTGELIFGTYNRTLAEAIARPIGVSMALFLLIVVRPVREAITLMINKLCDVLLKPKFARTSECSILLFLLVLILSGIVAGVYYAGASPLLGAWVAGCLIGNVDEASGRTSDVDVQVEGEAAYPSEPPREFPRSFRATYKRYFAPIQTPIFEPFFFATIGYAIPFRDLWNGRVIWRGLIYAILMALSKLVAGLWVLIWPTGAMFTRAELPACQPPITELPASKPHTAEASTSTSISKSHKLEPTISRYADSTAPSRLTGKSTRPFYPTMFLCVAMVARGEIGLIVAQLGGLTGEPYLVVMWAIVLCTIGGAVSVGKLLKHKRKQCLAGVWG
ncbi:Hsp70 ATPase ssc1 [Tulasnella sp. JGI-2019a]|nr:Hsp70 ATPase ssc1 [Tulasnella sp. JGI-2019a]KAG9008644.1 Hsp70 ATPase ssc1 [Tulasnella sp. JGI-2019a]KAG9033835.1 Hsp70 ATPase ssc1 [Tulasnella sp. JGI-2019a]